MFGTARDYRGLVSRLRRALHKGGFNPKTIGAYVRQVEDLVEFLLRNNLRLGLGEITREHIAEFMGLPPLDGEQARFRRPATKAFFAWLLDEGRITANPMEGLAPALDPARSVC